MSRGTHLLPLVAMQGLDPGPRLYSILVSSLTMQAVLQMSAGVLYPAPMSTSKDLYCRVWMSSVKCLC